MTLGADEEEYSISSQSCKSTTLAVGADCRVRIRFAPTDDGARPGALRLDTSPGGNTVVTIKGRGVE